MRTLPRLLTSMLRRLQLALAAREHLGGALALRRQVDGTDQGRAGQQRDEPSELSFHVHAAILLHAA